MYGCRDVFAMISGWPRLLSHESQDQWQCDGADELSEQHCEQP